MHPDDAEVRGLAQDDPVRVFNDLGEVQCPVALTRDIRQGTVSLAKGLWRKSTYNGSTTNALVPDTLTDLGGGACFNDARVEVALLGRHCIVHDGGSRRGFTTGVHDGGSRRGFTTKVHDGGDQRGPQRRFEDRSPRNVLSP